jgi:tripeptidyl-peptidase-1
MPDVAALGAWIAVVVNGQVQPLFGTSASSPIFGGMVTLLNAYRGRVNTNATLQAPLRQVPDLLYTAMRAGRTTRAPFTDVVEGDNCAGEPVQPGWSNNYPVYSRSRCFAAVAGWDAASGLGTPLFTDLLTAALTWDPAALPSGNGTTTTPAPRVAGMAPRA